MDIQPYVLRYWETEFEALAPGKSKSGQRVYSEHELGVIRRIKELLYEEGYTIAGAKKRLLAELEDGRSFAPPEAEGELFEAGPGGEEQPPVIALSGLAGARGESAVEAGDAGEVGAAEEDESEDTAQPGSDVGSAPSSSELTASGMPAWAVEPVEDPAIAADTAAMAPPEAAISSEPARSRAGTGIGTDDATGDEAAGPVIAAAGGVAASSGYAPAGEAEDSEEAARAVEPRPSRRRKTAVARAPAAAAAVDSALSKRVETLEHGLRRALDEVRHLRGLLADPSGDR